MYKIIFHSYLFLFIFNMINREFGPLIDIRYIILALGIICIFHSILKRTKTSDKKTFGSIILFYSIIAISNISYFNNSLLEVGESDFANLVLLNIFNFINILALYLNSKLITPKIVIKYLKISVIFLTISIIWVALGQVLPFTTYSGLACGDGHTNLFQTGCRYAGYGVDPNYVTMIMVVFITLLLKFEKKFSTKLIYIILSLGLIAISFSKTILLTFIPIFIITFFLKKFKNDKKTINNLIFLTIMFLIFLPLVLKIIRPFDNLPTMNYRYMMWDAATDLFWKNPVIGNGIGSFRSYFFLTSNWFIQAHSTTMQILSEHGIMALIIFISIFIRILKKQNLHVSFLLLIYLAWATTYETLYLSFFAFFIAMIPNIGGEQNEKSNNISN